MFRFSQLYFHITIDFASQLFLGKDTEQLGKDQTTISKWCTNSSQPDLGNLMQIAKILDVELTDLVRFEEFKNETE